MSGRLAAAPPTIAGLTSVRPLGTGGFADVFLFEQDMPRRPVAVKVLLQHVVDEDMLRMFNAEIDVMARLSAHPSILTIYEASVSSDGRPYIVMEYCPTSLTTRYRREVMPTAEVLTIGVKIASALETAHRAGILHRDIKPSNILETAFGAPVLSDFGIASSISAAPAGDEVFAMSVPWSAPEIIDERVAGSVASEVWALGATVYSLLAGRSPFEQPGQGQNSRDRLRARIRRAAYTPIGRDDVPPSLEAVLRRSMAKDPSDRFDSAAALAEALQQVQRELALAQTPLEVAVDAWAHASDMPASEGRRGPVRSSVAYASSRPRPTPRLPVRTGSDGPDETRRSRTPWLIIAIGAGAVLITAAAAATLVGVLGGY